MKILMAASECSPFATTGNFADDVLALASALKLSGHEVTVVLPLYRVARENKALKIRKTKTKFSVPVGPGKLPAEIFEATVADGIQVLLVGRDEFFDRSGLYGADGRDYQDNSGRFIFFSKCVIELARRATPDILHVHGWQTGLVPVFARDQRLPVVTVLTPYSLEYQGNFWSYDFALTNLPGHYFSTRGVEFYGSMNCLKAGILYSDAVVLPGRRYVAEMQTPEYGCGLENVLREQCDKLEGIPSGLDEAAWPVLPASAKGKARAALQQTAGLQAAKRVFLADATATQGLGVDLLLQSLDRFPTDDAGLLLLGPVQPAHTRALHVALRKHRGRLAHIEQVSPEVLQRALAGADFLILPGPVEPSGSLLILALRNGVVPLAFACGGLRQFVRDFDPVTSDGNGYVFAQATVSAIVDTVARACKASDEVHASLVAAARAEDFSWAACGRRHESLYLRLLGKTG